MWESGGKALLVRILGRRYGGGQLHVPVPLPPVKQSKFPLNGRLGGLQS